MKIIENLEITALSSEGFGIGRHNNTVIFVPYAIPGDVVNVVITKKKKKFFIAEIREIVRRSSLYKEPVCEHFGKCGGCKWLNLSYEDQLKFKYEKVENALTRIGKLEGININSIEPAPNQYHYRNKVEFSFNAENKSLGFHLAGHWDKVVHINTCHIVPQEINELRNEFHKFFLKKGVSFWNPRTHEGFLRQLVFRYGFKTKQVMAILVTSDEDHKLLKEFTDFVAEKFPILHSLIWILSTRKNDSYQGLPYTKLYGYDYIEEKIGDYSFVISPLSFFQTNTLATEKLYGIIKDLLPENTNMLMDLYCGTGSIAIYLSDKVQKAVGIEVIPEAVEDARKNARQNNISNVNFIKYDLNKNTEEIIKEFAPDVIVVDPPRSGLSKKLLNALLKYPPEHLIYVSCNPATQARDLQKLVNEYEILRIQPVDLFPNTPHVENVVLLKKKPQ